MSNLAAEMARNGVSISDFQAVLGCTDKTVRNKMAGATEFSVGEAMKIRDTFFPGMRIEYLFAQNENRKA